MYVGRFWVAPPEQYSVHSETQRPLPVAARNETCSSTQETRCQQVARPHQPRRSRYERRPGAVPHGPSMQGPGGPASQRPNGAPPHKPWSNHGQRALISVLPPRRYFSPPNTCTVDGINYGLAKETRSTALSRRNEAVSRRPLGPTIISQADERNLDLGGAFTIRPQPSDRAPHLPHL